MPTTFIHPTLTYPTLFRDIHMMAATLLLVVLIVTIKLARKHPHTVWNVAFIACILAYTLRIFFFDSHIPFLFFNALEYLAPVFFIACVRTNFQDQSVNASLNQTPIGKLEKSCFAVLGSLLVITTLLRFSEGKVPLPQSTTLSLLVWMQFGLVVFCVLAAFWLALQDWHTDLVAKRRMARSAFVFIGGPVILIVIGFHITANIWRDLDEIVSVAIALVLIFGALSIIFSTMQLDTDYYMDRRQASLSAPFPEKSNYPHTDASAMTHARNAIKDLPAAPDNEYQQELNILTSEMSKKDLFREMGLTLDMLAAQLDIPEYRLRKAINQGLGFRNFNVFLNTYRIEAAIHSLAKSSPETSVLDISIESGFRSLSTFNKAFKEATGKTPTEFRKNAAA